MLPTPILFIFFFFNDTATTEIYTLSLHDALPISIPGYTPAPSARSAAAPEPPVPTDRYRRSAEQHGGWAAASARTGAAARHTSATAAAPTTRWHRSAARPPCPTAPRAPGRTAPARARSEERRVGKEGRSRWS